MNFNIFPLLTIITLLFTSQSSANTEVIEYLDMKSAGWAHKVSDHAFVTEKNGCRIQWNAIENKNGDRYLRVRRNCELNFIDQIVFHRSLLTKISEQWPLDNFKYIIWGSLCDKDDWKWCRPIAKISLKSPEYIDYWKNYPNSKLKEVNSLFVKISNSSNSYSDFSELLNEFSIQVKLKSVEKVFSQRLNSSPFSQEFKEIVLNSNPKVMYNVGIAVFSIEQ